VGILPHPVVAIVIPVDLTEPLRLEQIDPTDLNAYRRLVGEANIEVVNLEQPDASMYMDEEGKLKELEVNQRATAVAWTHQSALRNRRDPIVGPAFIVGAVDRRGNDKTTPPELIRLLTEPGSFQVELQMDEDPTWHKDGLRFDQVWDAYIYAVQMAMEPYVADEVRVVVAKG
jgi:hypothetical protein